MDIATYAQTHFTTISFVDLVCCKISYPMHAQISVTPLHEATHIYMSKH